MKDIIKRLGIDNNSESETQIELLLQNLIFENISDAVAIHDRNHEIIWANKSYFAFTGKSLREIQGSTCWKVWGLEKKCIGCPVVTSLKTGLPATKELSPLNQPHWPEHQGYWLSRATPIKNTEGQTTGVIEVATNVTSLMENKEKLLAANQKLIDSLNHDDLTGLMRRRLFEDITENSIFDAKRRGEKLAVLFLDLENFKAINDSYGHSLGDRILKEAANKIKNILRKSDVLCRLGGDEFLICLKNFTDIDAIVTVAEKINNCFLNGVTVGNKNYNLGVSIGISIYPEDGKKVSELIRNADMAMYSIKKNKKNSFTLFNSAHKKEMEFINVLGHALKNREFVLHYQPIVDQYRKCCFIEALVRWNSPVYGLVPPLKFIPILEKNKEIRKVGSWIIKEAINQIKQINSIEIFKKTGVTINLSTIQLEDENFTRDLSKILKQTNINVENIFFEITESADTSRAGKFVLDNIENMKGLGVGIFLDDFGSGYSSINNLFKLPVSCVKIDKFLTENLLKDDSYFNAVASFYFLAERMKKKIVTEGIESHKQYEALRGTSSNYFQGYYFSKPAPNIIEVLEKNNGYFPLQ